MFDAGLLAFIPAAALLTIAPGADTMLVVRNVLRGSRRDGLVTTFGICSGLFIHAALSALGVSIILAQSAAAFTALKTVGALYLVWLGLQSWRKAGRASAHPLAETRRPCPDRRCFREGLLSNVLNPKTSIFYLAFLPQFIDAADPVLAKTFLLAVIHYAMSILWLGGISMALEKAREFVLSERVRHMLDRLCGATLAGMGALLLIEEA
jgi:RhtB (resistance to homoserine/threonine) family protein